MDEKVIKFLHTYQYPRLTLFIIMILVAYAIFQDKDVQIVIDSLHELNYIGIFIGGLFFTFGFTAPFSVAFFISAASEVNPLIAAAVAGLGALISDMLIFKFVKFSLRKEIKRFFRRGIMHRVNSYYQFFPNKIRTYLMLIFSGFIIASPLPDELGIMMLAGITKINTTVFAILSFLLNSIGVLIIFYISHGY